MLRRTAKSAQVSAIGRNAAEESALWKAHDRAVGAGQEAGGAAQRIASNVARQRAAVDTVADRARAIGARSQELAGSFQRVTDVFDRLGLVALNAGLEGARLGESGGKALLLVSDEVRAQATRGAETARDVATTCTELTTELAQISTHVALARETTGEVAEDAARVANACTEVEAALLELRDKLRQATSSDPETVRAIADTAENARALVTSLTALSGKVPKNLLLAALRPVLDSLSRLLSDEGEEEESE